MVFGTIKGFKPDKRLNHTIVVIALLAVLYCLIGLASGYVSLSQDLDKSIKPFEWDNARILYAAVGFIAFVAGF